MIHDFLPHVQCIMRMMEGIVNKTANATLHQYHLQKLLYLTLIRMYNYIVEKYGSYVHHNVT